VKFHFSGIAVGSEAFVRNTKEKLGIRAIGWKVIGEMGFINFERF